MKRSPASPAPNSRCEPSGTDLRVLLLRGALFIIAAALFGTLFDLAFDFRASFQGSDLFAYKVASIALEQGQNPYDPGVISRLQSQFLHRPVTTPNMVWNPPIFFLFPGVLFRLPEGLLYQLWPAFSCAAAAFLALLGSQLTSNRQISFALLMASLVSFPFAVDVYLSQLTALVAILPILGLTLFLFRRMDFLAGACMSFAIVKPHVFFLPLLVVGCWIVLQRRWRTVGGGLTGLALFGVAAEITFPGLWSLWLYRTSWPTEYFGSAWPLQIRSLAMSYGLADLKLLSIVFPIIGTIVTAVVLRLYFPKPRLDVVLTAIIGNQIFTPYGFVFDQVPFIFAQAFLLCSQKTTLARVRGFLILVLANSAPIVAEGALSEHNRPLSWALLNVTVGGAMYLLWPRKAHVGLNDLA